MIDWRDFFQRFWPALAVAAISLTATALWSTFVLQDDEEPPAEQISDSASVLLGDISMQVLQNDRPLNLREVASHIYEMSISTSPFTVRFTDNGRVNERAWERTEKDGEKYAIAISAFQYPPDDHSRVFEHTGIVRPWDKPSTILTGCNGYFFNVISENEFDVSGNTGDITIHSIEDCGETNLLEVGADFWLLFAAGKSVEFDFSDYGLGEGYSHHYSSYPRVIMNVKFER